ncbi:MAG TPA: MBL fold metallo-hydrolase [Ktedonobacteraceae bacterium]|nr:MBL fold metallo-hydrolase [Ktedonobacteraceae bacterium]
MSLGTPVVQCHILDTGYCLAWEHHILQGGARRRIACHSLVALLQHPEHGWLLWDTGYAPRMLEVTRKLPFSLYRAATPLRLQPELSVIAQLPRWGLKPADIRRVLISHFHADHIAGLRDFPAAEYLATQSAYEDIVRRRGLGALSRAFIPALLPEHFASQLTLLAQFQETPLPALGPAHDLFGDGSLLLIDLPGHARGQMGLFIQTNRGPLLFAADGCWMRRSIRESRPPSRLTHFFVDNPAQVSHTITRLHDFAQARPDVVVIPSHCPEAYAEEVEPGL